MPNKDKSEFMEYIREVNSSNIRKHEVDAELVSSSKALSAINNVMTVFGNIVRLVAGLAFTGAGIFIATRDAAGMTVEGVEDADPRVFLLIFGIIFGIIGLSSVISSIIGIVRTVKHGAGGIADSKEKIVFESTDENAVPDEMNISEFEPTERRNMSSAYYFFRAEGTGEFFGGMIFTVVGAGMAALIIAALAKTEPLMTLFALLPLIFAVLGIRMLVKDIKSRLKYVREMKERDRYTHY